MRYVLCLLLLESLARPLLAGTIIGNLPPVNETSGTTIGYIDNDPVRQEYVKAIGFTMGSTDYALTGAVLRLECNPALSATCVDLQSISLSIYTDSGANQLGSLYAGLGYSFALPLPTTWASYTFSPSASTSLIHGTTYWLVLAATISPEELNNALLWGRSVPSIAPSGAATYLGSLVSSDGGATWGASSVANSFELRGDATSASATPEPASMALFCLGIAGMLLVRKRSS